MNYGNPSKPDIAWRISSGFIWEMTSEFSNPHPSSLTESNFRVSNFLIPP